MQFDKAPAQPKHATGSLTLEPIGFIESCFKERFGTPRQPGLIKEARGVIQLRPEINFSAGLHGLENFSHVWVLFWFHQNENKVVRPKVHPPRLEGEKVGVFATRSPHRPNPIGISVFEIEKIEGNSVFIRGLDVIDGTPVLDIKPYIPYSDSIPTAKAAWAAETPPQNLNIEWTTNAIEELKSLSDFDETKPLAEAILRMDPRPGFYRGTKARPNPYMSTYGFRIKNLNISFEMQEDTARIVRVEAWDEFFSRSSDQKQT